VSVKHNLVYSLIIIINLAACFDPVGSSSGLHYEPINVRKLRTSLGSQNYWDPKDVRSFLTLIGS